MEQLFQAVYKMDGPRQMFTIRAVFTEHAEASAFAARISGKDKAHVMARTAEQIGDAFLEARLSGMVLTVTPRNA